MDVNANYFRIARVYTGVKDILRLDHSMTGPGQRPADCQSGNTSATGGWNPIPTTLVSMIVGVGYGNSGRFFFANLLSESHNKRELVK